MRCLCRKAALEIFLGADILARANAVARAITMPTVSVDHSSWD